MTGELAHFEIATKATGQASVVVNDEEVECSGFSVHSEVGKPPLLQLRMLGASGKLSGQGIVHVQLDEMAELDAVKRFLTSVAPNELDQKVCEKMEWASGSPMALALDVLLEMAETP